MPRGFYIKIDKWRYDVGDMVIFNIPEFGNTLIKYVAAGHASEFCIGDDATLLIDGVPAGEINVEKYPKSSPTQSTCQILKADEILVFGDHPNSFDSRYFGPIKFEQIVAEVLPFWLFE